jgi:hypothetical protein
MVNTARAETAQYEKLLKEANGKIDMLQAELKALKELVLTSTPSTPNKHLHPHLNSSESKKAGSGHSRQSSLNQQSFVIDNLSSNNGSNSSLNQTALSINSSAANLTVSDAAALNFNKSFSTHSANNSQANLFFKSHKREPSHNNAAASIKPTSNSTSFIDKLFSSSQKHNKNDTISSQLNNFPITCEIHEVKRLLFKIVLVNLR